MRLLCLLVLLPSLFRAQTPDIHFRHLTTEDGLSQDEIRAIRQDKRGLIWLAAFNGIHTYDGYTVRPWQTPHPDIQADMNAGIPMDIAFDAAGDLWIGTDFRGIYRYHFATQTFTRFLTEGNDSRHYVYHVLPEGNRVFWATSQGLFAFSLVTGNIQQMLAGQAISALWADAHHTLWIGTLTGGVWTLDRDGNLASLPLSVLKGLRISDFQETADGTLWISTDRGLFCRTPEGIRRMGMAAAVVHDLLQDAHQRLWLATAQGIACYEPEQQEVTFFRHQTEVAYSLSANDAGRLFLDRHNNLWVSTFNGGANWFYTGFDPFRVIAPVPGCGPEFWTAANTPDGAVWAGGSDCLLIRPNGAAAFVPFPLPGAIHLRRLLHDRHRSLVVGANEGLFVPDAAGHLKPLFPEAPPPDYPYRNITAAWQDEDGSWWWGAEDEGLVHYFPVTRQADWFRHQPGDTLALWHDYVTRLWRDHKGCLWVASYGGTQRFDPDRKVFVRLNHFAPAHEGKGGKSTIAHLVDRQGFFWLGRWEGGLDLFDPATNRYRHFGPADGLPSACVTTLVSDLQGNIWAGTTAGIVKLPLMADWFDLHQHPVMKVYAKRDGLPSNHISAGTGGMTAHGYELVFATEEGLVALLPDQLVPHTEPPVVIFTGVEVLGHWQDAARPVDELTEIVLSHRQNFFDLHFAALSFLQPELNRYAYRLDGFDADWIQCGTRRVAHYTNVPPGTYTFRVRAANNDGVWTPTDRTLRVVVQPAWWQTVWFRGLGLLLLAGGIFAFVRWREQRIRREAVLKAGFERQIGEIRMAALRAQMNPHFIFNALNGINRFILKNETEAASEYLTLFAKLIRHILDNSRSERISLEQELETLRSYVEIEQMRFSHPFTFSLALDPELEPMHLELPPMLIQPYLENAIWHGLMHKKGGPLTLVLGIRQEANFLVVSVTDNGVGRAYSRQLNAGHRSGHRSHGLQMAGERLELLNREQFFHALVKVEDLYDAAGIPSGTRVVIRIALDAA